jgi:hypothetical protein
LNRGVKYAIRLPANDSLERDISELLTRPVGRPHHKPVVWYKNFLYQAASWKTARRVVAKVEFHFGELFPRVGFIVTNLTLPSQAQDSSGLGARENEPEGSRDRKVSKETDCRSSGIGFSVPAEAGCQAAGTTQGKNCARTARLEAH